MNLTEPSEELFTTFEHTHVTSHSKQAFKQAGLIMDPNNDLYSEIPIDDAVLRLLSFDIPIESVAGIIWVQGLLSAGTRQLARYKNSLPLAGTRVRIRISELYGNHTNDLQMHEDETLPLWKRFAGALSDVAPSDYGYISLLLNDVQLNNKASDLLLKSFKSAPLFSLSLVGANLGSDGIRFVVDSLKTNATLELVSLRGSCIDSGNDAMSLIDAVVGHSKCDMLILDECEIGRNNCVMEALLDPALKSLKHVSLERNSIGSFGGKLISDSIACNPNIEVLYLGGNSMKDEDAVMLAKSLVSNTMLRVLSLSGNDFTKVGYYALDNAVLNLSSLNAVFDSNHTCYLDLGKDQSSRINYLADSKMNRKVKMMAVLSPHKERYTNVLFLGDVSVEMMPSVLFYLTVDRRPRVYLLFYGKKRIYPGRCSISAD